MCYLNPLIFPCFPGAERLQSEPLETLAVAVRGASAPTAWPAQGSKAPEAAAVSGLTMRDFGSGEWVLFFGRMGPVFFFFCGYGIMKIYCVIGLFFFFTCVCFFGMQI